MPYSETMTANGYEMLSKVDATDEAIKMIEDIAEKINASADGFTAISMAYSNLRILESFDRYSDYEDQFDKAVAFIEKSTPSILMDKNILMKIPRVKIIRTELNTIFEDAGISTEDRRTIIDIIVNDTVKYYRTTRLSTTTLPTQPTNKYIK